MTETGATRSAVILGAILALCWAPGCTSSSPRKRADAPSASHSFSQLRKLTAKHADSVVLAGAGDPQILVSPQLQGRIMTLRVGDVESTGFVDTKAIKAGAVNPQFNNFGGVDRFWLGPEAGQFGIYFPPGAELNRQTWKVPPDLDKGPYQVLETDSKKIRMSRRMQVRNYLGHEFVAYVEREVGSLTATDLRGEFGLDLPRGVSYAGAYSLNTLTNDDHRRWEPETGLIGSWILGQFNVSDSTVVIAPFRAGPVDELGPEFNDDYFGKVSVETPERITTIDSAVIFLGDGRRVGKFGLSQQRTTGVAGSMDFERNLLTIVKFDVPSTPERYGNSQWEKVQSHPYKGDVFQSYNNGSSEPDGGLAAAFYELESTSPVRSLGPGESSSHRHATHHFQGDYEQLADIAKGVLGVKLERVKEWLSTRESDAVALREPSRSDSLQD